MKHLFWATIILLLDVCISQDDSQESNVSIELSGAPILRVGQNFSMLCRVKVPIETCRVEIPSLPGMLLSPGQDVLDGIQYFGKSFEAGECGVHIVNVRENYDGMFKCTFVPRGERFERRASKRITVARPPSEPELIISPAIRGKQQYRKGQNVTVSCSSQGGRPAANVSLFLDGKPIVDEERPVVFDSNDVDNSLGVKTISRVLDWSDNGKTLRCVVDHIALDKSLETEKQLVVYFKPQPPSSSESLSFEYDIGQPGVANVTVRANPRPDFIWYVNEERIEEGQSDQSDRIGTSITGESGLWVATMRIDSVQESDFEKKYKLEARNGLGNYEYEIVLTMPTNHTDIGAKCETDNECLNGMEEEHAPMRCLLNQCACAEGFEGFEGKCQPMKHPEDKSGGFRSKVGGVSVFAMACFVLLSSIS